MNSHLAMTWNLAVFSVAIFVHVCLLIALIKKDNSIMTAAWPIGLLLIQIVWYSNLTSPTQVQNIMLIIVGLWATRLFIHAFLRNLRRGYEDFRYKELRDKGGSSFYLISYIQFFLFQGIFMLIVGIPFTAVNVSGFTQSQVVIVVGLVVFSIGFIIETVSDIQLTRFKTRSSKEEVLSTGLWGISRHPNYLGEILVWWSIGIISFSVQSWWVLISPLIVTLLLRYVSGVPLLEKRYDDNAEYNSYKETVNPIFPL